MTELARMKHPEFQSYDHTLIQQSNYLSFKQQAGSGPGTNQKHKPGTNLLQQADLTRKQKFQPSYEPKDGKQQFLNEISQAPPGSEHQYVYVWNEKFCRYVCYQERELFEKHKIDVETHAYFMKELHELKFIDPNDRSREVFLKVFLALFLVSLGLLGGRFVLGTSNLVGIGLISVGSILLLLAIGILTYFLVTIKSRYNERLKERRNEIRRFLNISNKMMFFPRKQFWTPSPFLGYLVLTIDAEDVEEGFQSGGNGQKIGNQHMHENVEMRQNREIQHPQEYSSNLRAIHEQLERHKIAAQANLHALNRLPKNHPEEDFEGNEDHYNHQSEAPGHPQHQGAAVMGSVGGKDYSSGHHHQHPKHHPEHRKMNPRGPQQHSEHAYPHPNAHPHHQSSQKSSYIFNTEVLGIKGEPAPRKPNQLEEDEGAAPIGSQEFSTDRMIDHAVEEVVSAYCESQTEREMYSGGRLDEEVDKENLRLNLDLSRNNSPNPSLVKASNASIPYRMEKSEMSANVNKKQSLLNGHSGSSVANEFEEFGEDGRQSYARELVLRPSKVPPGSMIRNPAQNGPNSQSNKVPSSNVISERVGGVDASRRPLGLQSSGNGLGGILESKVKASLKIQARPVRQLIRPTSPQAKFNPGANGLHQQQLGGQDDFGVGQDGLTKPSGSPLDLRASVLRSQKSNIKSKEDLKARLRKKRKVTSQNFDHTKKLPDLDNHNVPQFPQAINFSSKNNLSQLAAHNKRTGEEPVLRSKGKKRGYERESVDILDPEESMNNNDIFMTKQHIPRGSVISRVSYNSNLQHHYRHRQENPTTRIEAPGIAPTTPFYLQDTGREMNLVSELTGGASHSICDHKNINIEVGYSQVVGSTGGGDCHKNGWGDQGTLPMFQTAQSRGLEGKSMMTRAEGIMRSPSPMRLDLRKKGPGGAASPSGLTKKPRNVSPSKFGKGPWPKKLHRNTVSIERSPGM